MSNKGHRRISNELFLKHFARNEWKEIAALLSLDGDHRDGGEDGFKSISGYARIFGQSRNWVRTRIGHYLDSRSSLYTRTYDSAKDPPGQGERHPQDTHRTPTKNLEPEVCSSSVVNAKASTSIHTLSADERLTLTDWNWSRRLAELMITLIKPLPGAVIPRNARHNWAAEIEKLAKSAPELKANPEAQIENAIRFVLAPENVTDQYCPVVRSGGALRKKWSNVRNAQLRAERGPVNGQMSFAERDAANNEAEVRKYLEDAERRRNVDSRKLGDPRPLLPDRL